MTKDELINKIAIVLNRKRTEYQRNHEDLQCYLAKDPSEKTVDELVDLMRKNAYYEGQIKLSLEIVRLLKQAKD